MTLEEINHEIGLLEPAEVNFRNVQVLSSLYVIRDNLAKGFTAETYVMPTARGTEFNNVVSGVKIDELLDILNEHMEVVNLLMPKEYKKLIEEIGKLRRG